MISLVKGEQSANDRGWMELTKEMACELIDKIVVHEAIGKKPNRQRESNAAHRAKTKAERWAANDGHKYPKRICEQCGKEFYPNSTRQRFCNTDCTKAHQQAEKEKKLRNVAAEIVSSEFIYC